MTDLQSCVTFVISVLTVYVWLKSPLRSTGVFKQIKSEDKIAASQCIYIDLPVLVNIKYQTH